MSGIYYEGDDALTEKILACLKDLERRVDRLEGGEGVLLSRDDADKIEAAMVGSNEWTIAEGYGSDPDLLGALAILRAAREQA